MKIKSVSNISILNGIFNVVCIDEYLVLLLGGICYYKFGRNVY